MNLSVGYVRKHPLSIIYRMSAKKNTYDVEYGSIPGTVLHTRGFLAFFL
jgi:hypothetical protein